MTLFHRALLFSALLGVLALAACDSIGGEPDAPTATVEVTLETVFAQGTCDAVDTPSEYQILVTVRDHLDREVWSVTKPRGTPYGERPPSDAPEYIQLYDGEYIRLQQDLSFQQSHERGFSVSMAVIEWDRGRRDVHMDNNQSTKEHFYTNDGYGPIEGDQILPVQATDGDCTLSLHYTVTVQ